MANMHGRTNCSSSSSPADPDDFSLFLHQIMLRSSPSSLTVQKGNEMQSFEPTCNLQPEDQELRFQSSPFPDPSGIPLPESSPALNSSACIGFASPGAGLPESTVNASSSSINSVGTAENELNEYDCDSEEGFEGVVVEAPAKPTPSSNPSKRSRAAEVHNLSEKRRRSRINEKMKALQNLIPNSNKTDKASMLDEAIEYLKQLQLQVQLLTMRNGISLYPMCLPGVLQSNKISQMRMGYSEGSRSLNVSMARTIPLDQTTPTNMLFTLPDHYPNQEQTSFANLRKLNDSDSFGLETSSHIHHESFQQPLPGCSEGICLERKLPCQLVKEEVSRTSAVGHTGAKATSSVPFNEESSDLEENTLEAFILGRDQSKEFLINSDRETLLVSQFDG